MDNMQVLPVSNEVEEQISMRKNRDKLPKFVLGRHEGFNISRKEITELNDSYHQMLQDLDADDKAIPQELRSYMESVIFVSYVSEIEKRQRENYLDCEVERERIAMLSGICTPRRWRSIFSLFRLKRNQSAILLDELVGRQARAYYNKKESELPISEEGYETEEEPYTVQLEALRAYLPRMRKSRRVVIETIITSIASIFESNTAKLRQLSAEVQAERAKVEELTAEAKKEAVKRLITCLNAVKDKKQPIDWEILKVGRPEEPEEPEELPEEDEETDELEYWGDATDEEYGEEEPE